MVKLSYTTYISGDQAHHEIFRAKVAKVGMMHDDAPVRTSGFITYFLKPEKVTVFPHTPYSPDLAPATFSFFQN